MDAAWIGLWGVILGALISLVGTVLIPWWRDSLDRKRIERETLDKERRDALIGTMAALMEMRQALGKYPALGEAQARFGTRVNELTLRLTPEEQPIVNVLYAMLSMILKPNAAVAEILGEAMGVLTLWVRGDVKTEDVIPDVERRARVKFSDDQRTVSRV